MSSRMPIVMLILCLTLPQAVTAKPFTFVALGDMPYEPHRDEPRFNRLIDAVATPFELIIPSSTKAMAGGR